MRDEGGDDENDAGENCEDWPDVEAEDCSLNDSIPA